MRINQIILTSLLTCVAVASFADTAVTTTTTNVAAAPAVVTGTQQQVTTVQQVPASPNQVQSTAAALIHNNATQIFNNPNDIVVGNINGSVTLVEFFDYQSDAARSMAPSIANLIQSNPSLRVVYKEIPPAGNDGSLQAAHAAYAAYGIAPKEYPEFHAYLMSAPLPFSLNTVAGATKQTSINYSQLLTVMSDKRFDTFVQSNTSLAQALLVPTLGAVTTPVVIVGYTQTTATSPVVFASGNLSQPTLQGMISQIQQ